MINRRELVGAALAAGAVGLAGCSAGGSNGDNGSNTSGTTAGGYPKLSWTGTITTGVQAYTPALSGVKLTPGSTKLQQFGKAAEAFQKIYPGITIKFLGSEYTYDPNMMKTQATGGQLPDLWWQQATIVNSSFPTGICTNLTPYMEQANPFIKGNSRWRDIFNAQSYTMASSDAQTQYCNNGDFVGTAFFYNKKIFSSVGVTTPPTTWAELMSVCDKLQKAGHTPCAIPLYSYGFGWLARIFLANFLGEDTCKKIESFSDQKGISLTDVAVALHQGILDSRKNPAVLAWWPMAKQLFGYCDPQINQLPANPPAGSPTTEGQLAAGKVAMIYDGTWAPNTVKADGGDLDIGSFAWPSLAGSNQYAHDFDTSNAVSGPNAAWQFYISTPRSDTSLRDKGKLDAVVAWMQFFSTPQWNTSIVNELGSFIPTYDGAKIPEKVADLAKLADTAIYGMNGGAELTSEASDQTYKLFQSYVLGQVTMDQVAAQYPTIMDKALNDYLEQHPIDFSKYPG